MLDILNLSDIAIATKIKKKEYLNAIINKLINF